MTNKLRRVFCPTPEEELEDMNLVKRVAEKAYREKWCSFCKQYIPIPDNLPGFVTAFPECKLGGLATQTCLFYDADGKKYEQTMARYKEWEERIQARMSEAAKRRNSK